MDAVGRRAQRQGQVEAVVVGFDAEKADIARRRGQCAVEIAHRVVERVVFAVEPRPRVQQGDLVVVALGGVAGAHLRSEGPHAADREVGADDLLHAFAQCVGLGGREFVDSLDLAVEAAAAQRMPDVEFLRRVEVLHRFLQDEPGGALVDADAGERREIDEAHRGGRVEPVAQFFDPVVHFGRQEGEGARSDACRKLRKRGARSRLDAAAEVVADDLDGIGHRETIIRNNDM